MYPFVWIQLKINSLNSTETPIYTKPTVNLQYKAMAQKKNAEKEIAKLKC